MSEPTPMLVAVRGYAVPVREVEPSHIPRAHTIKPIRESDFTLVFDCETRTDHTHSLRFGTFQVRRKGKLERSGIFYEPNNPKAIGIRDMSMLRAYAKEKEVELLTREQFVDRIFYKYALRRGALVVGFNLPFDISRLAIGVATSHARDMRGAFSFKLSRDWNLPNVLIRHLNARTAFMRFASLGTGSGRGMRNKRLKVPSRRGYFLDLKTLATSLLGEKRITLQRLAERLDTPHQKLDAGGHGKQLTRQYIEYAVADTQVTWECYERLTLKYAGHCLTDTPAQRIYSEASLGKAYLRSMGIKAWREVQRDVPPELIGNIMGTYYGGRSEVRLRREIARVLYADFRSMYPTVFCLQGLWSFVIGKGFDWQDWTDEATKRLAVINLADLQNADIWKSLAVIVQVEPDDDIFPLRAAYNEKSRTIGLNIAARGSIPIWFTLADCVASKLLTGKAPKVLQAFRFTPRDAQDGLRPIELEGGAPLNPHSDFFREVILRRGEIKIQEKTAGNTYERELLGGLQMMLKLLANSTSYGIFAEQNVQSHDRPRPVTIFGQDERYPGFSKNIEEPGSYFNPLLATLITGAARLMLAIGERLTLDRNLGWAFCDTDSLAIVRPDGMEDHTFLKATESITSWFQGLDPYGDGLSLFKIEDQNFALDNGRNTDQHEPLYAMAVSAKRYVLFNIDSHGNTIIRKALAHGLGHLLAPYRADEAPASIPEPSESLSRLEIDRWQHDLWHRIISAFREGHPDLVDLSGIPALDLPARSRYGANTAPLRNWFKRFNQGKPLNEQVIPFNFLLAYQVSKLKMAEAIARGKLSAGLLEDGMPAVVAPFDENPKSAVKKAFDRRTGKPVPASILMTYREVLADYARHDEAKFEDGAGLESGLTARRRIKVVAVEYIGKEANRWEEQFYLGELPEAQVEYGLSATNLARFRAHVTEYGKTHTLCAIAERAGLSRQQLAAIAAGLAMPRVRTIRDVLNAFRSFVR